MEMPTFMEYLEQREDERFLFAHPLIILLFKATTILDDLPSNIQLYLDLLIKA